MATTTPNYGWTVPTSTDLVKDGATAIETLGDAIDASMNTALGTKKAGMVLLNTTSFSGVSSQSINDVFSTTYKNYRFLFYGNASGFTGLQLRYRVSGSDATGANYTRVATYISDSVNPTKTKESAQTSHGLGPLWANHTSIAFDIFNPFETQRTQLQGINWTWNDNSTWEVWTEAGIFDNAISYTGFTIYPTSGTITGSVSVYGYNK